MNIYVGNLSSQVTESDLREAFEPYGVPTSVSVIKDKFTGESRGFAFVEMPSKESSESAISGLNGKELKGKSIVANEARKKTDSGRSNNRKGTYGNRTTRYY